MDNINTNSTNINGIEFFDSPVANDNKRTGSLTTDSLPRIVEDKTDEQVLPILPSISTVIPSTDDRSVVFIGESLVNTSNASMTTTKSDDFKRIWMAMNPVSQYEWLTLEYCDILKKFAEVLPQYPDTFMPLAIRCLETTQDLYHWSNSFEFKRVWLNVQYIVLADMRHQVVQATAVSPEIETSVPLPAKKRRRG